MKGEAEEIGEKEAMLTLEDDIGRILLPATLKTKKSFLDGQRVQCWYVGTDNAAGGPVIQWSNKYIVPDLK